MAKQIIWSKKALKDRKEILQYWINRNKSTIYSRKLNDLFQVAVQLVATHPEIGSPTDFNLIRSKIVRDYQIFYKDSEAGIQILAIWDSRQNPDNLKDKLR